jgi:hypothetical protein
LLLTYKLQLPGLIKPVVELAPIGWAVSTANRQHLSQVISATRSTGYHEKYPVLISVESSTVLAFIITVVGICPIPKVDISFLWGHKGPPQLKNKSLRIIDYASHCLLLLLYLIAIT